MSEKPPSKHIGKKIWYSVAIGLSALVLLISAVGVVGTWVVERPLTDATVNLLSAVENMAGGLRQVGQRLDQGAADIQQVTTNVADVSTKISQNVNDQGLVALLLPAEQEQKLVDTASSVQDSLNNIREMLTAGLSFYQSIDRLPFVSLPKPGTEQVAKIEQTIADVQVFVKDLRQKIQDFRSGVAGGIDKVTQAADQVTQRVDELRNNLAKLDSDLSAMQATIAHLKQVIPTIFFLFALLITLFLIYVIYTQVEVIRLYVQRWRGLGQNQVVAPEE